MSNALFLWLFLVLATPPKILIKCEPNWTYDLISLEVENKTPDILFFQAEITRPRRGVFAFSGILDIKEDLTDQTHTKSAAYYSLTGSNFVKSPFGLPETTLTEYLNNFYKDFLMESFLNCSENAPRTENKFVAPLTKRVIQFKDCIISNKNMPSRLKSGYYKVILWYTNYAEGSLEFLVKVEQK